MRAFLAQFGLAICVTIGMSASDTRAETPDDPTLRAMIGQMVLMGFKGNSLNSAWFQTMQEQAKNGEITGVLYLRRNVTDEDTVAVMNAVLQSMVEGKPPLLIALDQEGGRVQRLKSKNGFTEIASPQKIAESRTPLEAEELYANLAAGLKNWGFNLNLGPVVDLNINPDNPVIGRLGRSFSAKSDVVVDYSAAFINGHRQHQILTALKHFPGHGSSQADSHKGFVDVSDSWKKTELDPYRQLLRAGKVDMVMSAHVRNTQLQAQEDRFPATLSPTVIKQVLRDQLGFDGVVISDDMQMGAIRKNYGFDEAVVAAVKAGHDILVFANDKNPDITIPGKVIDLLARQARKDPALLRDIEAAHARILALKAKISWAMPAPADPITTGSVASAASQIIPVVSPAFLAQQNRNYVLAITR